MNSLRDAVEKYVAIRRSLGTQLQEPAVALVQFVEFLEREGSSFITTELAVRWARQPEGIQPATWARRLTAVRLFAAWLSAFDPRTEIPPRGIFNARHRRKKPHIYTNQEIQQLMAETARLPSPRRLRAVTHTTFIGLLAATGLRPGEALALNVPDADLENGILTIRETKFGKSRFVPVHDSTRTALVKYTKQRNKLCPHRRTEAFFVSERGTRLLQHAARRTFAKVSVAIGIRKPTDSRHCGRGPRLQDLRHTFATRTLIEWYRAGLDVRREMPKLTTYLGHVDVANTYWYIEAVPELLQLATEHLAVRKPGGA